MLFDEHEVHALIIIIGNPNFFDLPLVNTDCFNRHTLITIPEQILSDYYINYFGN